MKSNTAVLALLTLGAFSVHAATFTAAMDNDYKTPGNWSGGVVPNTAGGDTAQINNGSAVTYNPGGDFAIGNGGTLQITNGSWTQITSGAWIQLGQGAGNGHILVDGGTFNQGTAGNNPFNVNGTGNTFTVTSGAANFSSSVQARSGVAWSLSGGTTTMTVGNLEVQSGGVFSVSGGSLNIAGGVILQDGSSWSQTGGTVTLGAGSEFDYNSLTGCFMSGGVLNVPKLLTGVNGPVGSSFDFSGGVINDGGSVFNGWYGADNANHPFNFTLGSTGVINFLNSATTISQVTGWLAAGGIQYNDTIAPSAFSVTQPGGTGTTVILQVIPEPSSLAAFLVGATGLLILRRRRA